MKIELTKGYLLKNTDIYDDNVIIPIAIADDKDVAAALLSVGFAEDMVEVTFVKSYDEGDE